MTLLRTRQPGITRIFPHQANRKFIIPSRPRLKPIPPTVNQVSTSPDLTTRLTSNPCGLVDGTSWTFSMWLRFRTVGSMYMWGATEDASAFEPTIVVNLRGDNFLVQFRGRNAAFTVIQQCESDISAFPGAASHLAIAIQAEPVLTQQVYIDGVDHTALDINDAGLLSPLPPGEMTMFGGQANSTFAPNPFNGDAAEYWMDDSFVDLSGGGIDKFRDPVTGLPADLGSNGQTPTGSTPQIYFGRGMTADTGGIAANGTGEGWNGGANLGIMANFARTGTAFTDVP